MASNTDTDKPKASNPSTLVTPPPTYKQVAVTPILPTSKLVTLAGQTGVDPSTGSVPDDFQEQVKLAYINVSNALKSAGASPRDIIHVRHYVVQQTGDAEKDQMEIYDRGWAPLWIEFMDREADGHRPPDTLLGVASLAKKGVLYEVEAWAIIHGQS